jgi:beta-glucosidase
MSGLVTGPAAEGGEAIGGALPPGFRFGVATAAYQIEGAAREDGRGESIWDRFAHTPGRVAGGDTGDVACDHYHRWRSDLDLMAGLGIEAYRFSIAWPRVLPDGAGAVNAPGLRFYRELAEGLLERGIEPIATLYHWDLPQALQDQGGWASRDTAARFAEYASAVAAELGDVVSEWVTINEPWVVAFQGHAHGTKAPGMRDWPTALRAGHHALLAHGLGTQAVRAAVPGARVGITLNLAPIHPAGDADHEAALLMDGHLNRWFLDPVVRGRYPSDMLELYERRFGPLDFVEGDDLSVIATRTEFMGVNYYAPQRVRADASRDPLGVRQAPPGPPTTAMGWEVAPEGLHELLVRVRNDYGDIPIYITENGASYDDPPAQDGRVEDPERVAYLESHVAALRAAIADGVRVERYCVWSLLDNFEWEHGYGKRFGIVFVDYETQRRIPKRSGLWYRDYIERTRDGAAAATGPDD